MNDLRYPIGKFSYPAEYSSLSLSGWKDTIQKFPERLENIIKPLGQEDLMKAYRPEGWNILQVVHHCADSHMNAIIRLKLALTESNPTIKPYMENLWAELPDSFLAPASTSLEILKGVHHRWSILLDKLNNKDWHKSYVHPESGKITRIWEMTALYAWHCGHHFAHVEQALKGY